MLSASNCAVINLMDDIMVTTSFFYTQSRVESVWTCLHLCCALTGTHPTQRASTNSGDHVRPDQQTPRTRPRFDFTDPKEEWFLPPSLLQQRGAGDDAPPQQHNAGQSELFTAELLRQWQHGALWSNYIWWLILCCRYGVSGRVYHTYTSENKLIHSLEA